MDINELLEKLLNEHNPWNRDMFPTDDDKAVAEAMPDTAVRSAIAGHLMRHGWELCIKKVQEFLEGTSYGEEYTYPTLEDYCKMVWPDKEDIEINEPFRIGWDMARTKNKHLGIFEPDESEDEDV